MKGGLKFGLWGMGWGILIPGWYCLYLLSFLCIVLFELSSCIDCILFLSWI